MTLVPVDGLHNWSGISSGMLQRPSPEPFPVYLFMYCKYSKFLNGANVKHKESVCLGITLSCIHMFFGSGSPYHGICSLAGLTDT